MSVEHRTFDARLELLPQEPGVYLMKDTSGSVIYVGKAINLPNRLRNYFTPHPNVEPKIQAMISHIADFSYIVCANELEALILENNLIKKYRPKYNTLLRDDKEYPYIKVTLNESYPRVMKAYRIGKDRDLGARYYGPYLAWDLQKALRTIYQIFPVMTCNRILPRDIDKQRPCLKYYINRCIGPCKGEVSVETYRESVDEICRFLDGQYDDLLKNIKIRMQTASERLQFEEAAIWRDRYQNLKKLTTDQIVVTKEAEDIDALGIAENDNEICLQKLEIRRGRMIGMVSSFTPNREEKSSEWIEAFIKQHYVKSSFIPSLILLPEDLENASLLMAYLSRLAQRKIELRSPKRGEKKRILQMAQTNAEQQLRHHTLLGGTAAGRMQALKHLAKIVGAESPLHRIEAYDMANFGSADRTGAMIVFTDGKPLRSAYRHFHIKSFDGIDDYRAMAEVINRRISRLKEEEFGEKPDLILLDGGFGHVRTIEPLLQQSGLNIPLAGIVKDNRHKTNGLVLADKTFIALKKTSETTSETPEERSERLGLLRLLTAVQNEAHYFAGRLLKKSAFKRTIHYSLEDISGIGPARRRSLLKHFSTIKNISKASFEQLKDVPNLPENVARTVYWHFHPEAENAENVKRQDERQ